jgi:ADP-heptose:LPS heptosyltransferase
VGDYFGHDVPVVELNLKVADALLNILGQASQPFSPSFCLPAPSEMVRAKVDGLLHTIYIRNRSKNLSPDLLRDLPGDLPGDLSGEKPLVSDVPLLPSAMPSAEVSPNLSGSFCVLIPGTTWVTKIWPEHSWYQLGAALSQKYNYKLLIVGGRSETQVNQTLCQKLNALKPGLALDLTNETSLIDLSVIFELSSLVVGGDTGPLHLAAAIGKPKVLGIYGSTPWRRNGPYGEHCRSVSLQLNCQPCYAKHCRIKTIDCLRTLTVDQVMAAINQLLENHPPIDAVSSC